MPKELEVYHEMRDACAGVLIKYGIPPRHADMERLISREQVRKALVRAEYEELKPSYGDARQAQAALARKFRLSVEYVKKILYEK